MILNIRKKIVLNYLNKFLHYCLKQFVSLNLKLFFLIEFKLKAIIDDCLILKILRFSMVNNIDSILFYKKCSKNY